MNGHNERRPEIEALRARISRLGAVNLPISESPDLRTVLHEALEGARGLTAALEPPRTASQPLRHADLPAYARGSVLSQTRSCRNPFGQTLRPLRDGLLASSGHEPPPQARR